MDSESVQNNEESTSSKKLGGVTGKGFMPGQSGNPGGRPKRAYLTEVAEELLEEMMSDPVQRAEYKQSLKAKLLAKGVVSAMTLDKVWERTEGKIAQPVRVSGDLTVSLADELRKADERVERIKNQE